MNIILKKIILKIIIIRLLFASYIKDKINLSFEDSFIKIKIYVKLNLNYIQK